MMVHANIDDRPPRERHVSSIGEGMVDITAVEPDYRVFPIKRAGANMIDHIEQLQVPAGDQGPQLKAKAMELVLQAVQYAKEAAALREPKPQVHPPLEYTHEHPEGAPV
jgi:hypothetical protein